MQVYVDRGLLLWQFVQLFPMDVVDEFAGPNSIPLVGISQLLYVIRYVKTLFVGPLEWGDMILFFTSLFIVLFSFCIRLWNSIVNCLHRRYDKIVLPRIFRKLLFDALYIPIIESLFRVFPCTYSCHYDPDNPPSDPYPPYDVYTDISCSSSLHIILFSLAVIAVGFYHFRASQFIVKEESKEKLKEENEDSNNDDDDDSESYAPDKFRYAECMLRFYVSAASELLAFVPLAPLIINLVAFIILLLYSYSLQPASPFDFNSNNLNFTLYLIQTFAALMQMLAYFFSSQSAVFALLIITFIPLLSYLGWKLNSQKELHNVSYSTGYLHILLDSAYLPTRRRAAEILLSDLRPEDDEDPQQFTLNDIGCFENFKTWAGFSSKYIRGATVEALYENALRVAIQIALHPTETFLLTLPINTLHTRRSFLQDCELPSYTPPEEPCWAQEDYLAPESDSSHDLDTSDQSAVLDATGWQRLLELLKRILRALNRILIHLQLFFKQLKRLPQQVKQPTFPKRKLIDSLNETKDNSLDLLKNIHFHSDRYGSFHRVGGCTFVTQAVIRSLNSVFDGLFKKTFDIALGLTDEDDIHMWQHTTVDFIEQTILISRMAQRYTNTMLLAPMLYTASTLYSEWNYREGWIHWIPLMLTVPEMSRHLASVPAHYIHLVINQTLIGVIYQREWILQLIQCTPHTTCHVLYSSASKPPYVDCNNPPSAISSELREEASHDPRSECYQIVKEEKKTTERDQLRVFVETMLLLSLHPDSRVASNALLLLTLIPIRTPSAEERIQKKLLDDYNQSDSDSSADQRPGENRRKRRHRKEREYYRKLIVMELPQPEGSHKNKYNDEQINREFAQIVQAETFTEDDPHTPMEYNPPKPQDVYKALRHTTEHSTDTQHIRIFMETLADEETLRSVKELAERIFGESTIERRRVRDRYTHPLFIYFNDTPLRLHPHTHSLTYGSAAALRPHERSKADKFTFDSHERQFLDIGTLNTTDGIYLSTPFTYIHKPPSYIESVADSLKEFIQNTRTSSAVWTSIKEDEFAEKYCRYLVRTSLSLTSHPPPSSSHSADGDTASTHSLSTESPSTQSQLLLLLLSSSALQMVVDSDADNTRYDLKLISPLESALRHVNMDEGASAASLTTAIIHAYQSGRDKLSCFEEDSVIRSFVEAFRTCPALRCNKYTQSLETFLSTLIWSRYTEDVNRVLMIQLFGVHILAPSSSTFHALDEPKFPVLYAICDSLSDWIPHNIDYLSISDKGELISDAHTLHLPLSPPSVSVDEDDEMGAKSSSSPSFDSEQFECRVAVKEGLRIFSLLHSLCTLSPICTIQFITFRTMKTISNIDYIHEKASANFSSTPSWTDEMKWIIKSEDDDNLDGFNPSHEPTQYTPKEVNPYDTHFSFTEDSSSESSSEDDNTEFGYYPPMVSAHKRAFYLLKYGAICLSATERKAQIGVENINPASNTELAESESVKESRLVTKYHLQIDPEKEDPEKEDSGHGVRERDDSHMEGMERESPGRRTREMDDTEIEDEEEENNAEMPTANRESSMLVKFIALCLFSQITEIRMAALSLIIALLNRSDTFTRDSDVLPSSSRIVCQEFALFKSLPISGGVYYNIGLSYDKENNGESWMQWEGGMISAGATQSSAVLRVLCLHSLAALADASFSRVIHLSVEERQTLIINQFSHQSVIEWVGHFDTSTPSVETVVVRLLFILISTAPSADVAALCHSDESSVLPVLFNSIHTVENTIYGTLSLLQIFNSALNDPASADSDEKHTLIVKMAYKLLPRLINKTLAGPLLMFYTIHNLFEEEISKIAEKYHMHTRSLLKKATMECASDEDDYYYSINAESDSSDSNSDESPLMRSMSESDDVHSVPCDPPASDDYGKSQEEQTITISAMIEDITSVPTQEESGIE